MRKALFIALCCALPLCSHSQLSISGDATYLIATEWDDIFRVYDFARPWQEERQPFLTAGWNVRLGWYIPVRRRQSLWLHPEAGWARWRSFSDNPGNTLFVCVDQFSAQVNVNFNPRALLRDVFAGPLGTRWLLQISPGVSLWQGYAERNEEPWLTDAAAEEEWRPQHIAFFASAGIGYRAWMIAGWAVTPRAGVRWFPSVELDGLAQTVNGTDLFGLSGEARHVWMLTGGLEFTLLFPRRK